MKAPDGVPGVIWHRFYRALDERLLEMATAPDAPISITDYKTWSSTSSVLHIQHNLQVRDALVASWQDATGASRSELTMRARQAVWSHVGAMP